VPDMLTYRPWVPREGMKGTYEHLFSRLGSPERWLPATRDVVCERGAPVPLKWDDECVKGTIWYVRHGLGKLPIMTAQRF
jgi:hypothetical protein